MDPEGPPEPVLTLKAPTAWATGCPLFPDPLLHGRLGYGFAHPDQPWLLLPQHPGPPRQRFLPPCPPLASDASELSLCSLGKRAAG